MPRKDIVDSVRMMPPRLIVHWTISCGMTFGTRWRKIRLETEMPVASAATMNSCSRSGEDLAADDPGDEGASLRMARTTIMK